MEPNRQSKEMKIAGNFPPPAPYTLLRSLHRRCLQPLPTVRSRLLRGGFRTTPGAFLKGHQYPEKDRSGDGVSAWYMGCLCVDTIAGSKISGDRRYSDPTCMRTGAIPIAPESRGSLNLRTQGKLSTAGAS